MHAFISRKTSTVLRSSLLAALLTAALMPMGFAADAADAEPTLSIQWPPADSSITLGQDQERAIGVVVSSNFRLKPAGQCGSDKRCGHVHLKIDPDGDTCNQPGKPYNSMNSDFGGPLIAARFGYCQQVAGSHVIGALLADDHHKPLLVNGKPVTALVRVQVQVR